MRKTLYLFLMLISITLPLRATALLSMELTRGVAGAIPIAVLPFAKEGDHWQDMAAIISTDLKNSGRFKLEGKGASLISPSDVNGVSTDYFSRLGTNNVVIGKVIALGNDRFSVSFQLLDVFRGKGASSVELTKKFTTTGKDLRAVAHRISDLIYKHMTGTPGVFSTKIAYVLVEKQANGKMRYVLEVCDQDGYNPRPLLISPEPIMSPAWSPDGKIIAYVSFENQRAGIYLEEVATGTRRLLSEFPGVNGAPAWSPDGKKLAIVLSKSGTPNIYVMDIATHKVSQITNDFYINTEPAWSPDGKSLLFTSNRSGGPQIYQVKLASKSVSRLTYDGDYNARAAYTRDGNHVAMIHRVSGTFTIGILDLDTGVIRVLNGAAGDSTSPSVAPNGSMILYDTILGSRNVLGMVSADGRIQLNLPAQSGDAQDPAWSPYLT